MTPIVTRTLSEHESKRVLAAAGVPVLDERVVETPGAAVDAAREVAPGAAVVAKLCGDGVTHKTERGLVRLGLHGDDDVRVASAALLDAATPEDGAVGVLVAPMVRGSRELIAGVYRDEQFGPSVMLGVGGVLAEALADVAFRLVPVERVDAEEMLDDLAAQPLLGPVRGEPPVDRGAVADVVLGLSQLTEDRPDIVSVDINPLVVVDGRPVAVDALVEVPRTDVALVRAMARRCSSRAASSWRGRRVIPGSSGSSPSTTSSATTIRARCSPPTSKAARSSDGASVTSLDDLPEGAADLVFVCTPAAANLDLLKACAAKGVKAAFVTSAGYGEAGEDGRAAERDLVELAHDARHAARRPERPGRRLDAGVAVRADRGPVSAVRRHRHREPVRQLRVVVPELRRADEHRREPRRLGRQRRRRHGAGLPRVLRGRRSDDRRGSRTSKESPTGGVSSSGSVASPAANRSSSSRVA